jgi:peptide/nickel transport system permease protein
VQFVRTKPLGAVGALIIVGMLFVALFARALARTTLSRPTTAQFARPTPEHWFGTDEFGRDVLSRDHVWSADRAVRRLHGVARGCAIGGLLGCRQRLRGWTVTCCWSASWTFSCAFPQLILALAVASILGPAVQNVVIAVAIPIIPRAARVVRATALVGEGEPVRRGRAARWARVRRRVVLQHICPNVLAPFIIIVTRSSAAPSSPRRPSAISAWATAEPTPSWG